MSLTSTTDTTRQRKSMSRSTTPAAAATTPTTSTEMHEIHDADDIGGNDMSHSNGGRHKSSAHGNYASVSQHDDIEYEYEPATERTGLTRDFHANLSGPSNNTAGSYASVAASPGTIKGAAATAALAPIEAHTLLHTPLAENIELTHAYQDQQVKQSKQKTITVSGDDSTIIETYGNGIQDGMCKRFSNTVLQ